VTDAHGSGILRPGIRTYKPRRSRITARQSAALLAQDRWLLAGNGPLLDLGEILGPSVVMEIGFGTGTATAPMAAADPALGVLAVDIHTPGVGNLLDLIARNGLENVRVIEGDALTVLRHRIAPHALVGVRSYFPDPWPKARHHKRRLVQQPVLDVVRERLVPDGYWHLATDWDDYVDFALAVFAADPNWTGGVIDRPDWRPVTHYEARALREGRRITDLMFHARGRIEA
jgi:tRNA (guanine-N7-)-methyltransferase